MANRRSLNRRHFIKYSTLGLAGIVGGAGNLVPTGTTFGAARPRTLTPNPIVVENNMPGTPNWQLTNSGDDTKRQIKGYASATSVNKGNSIDFHVSVNPPQTYTMEIYRIGWYNGTGGRLMTTVGPLNGVTYTVPAPDATFGTVDCNWPVTSSLPIPTNWTTGVYLVKLINSQGWQNHIHFVVRDDSGSADLMFQCSVTTYHAYDAFGGKSLYPDNSTNSKPAIKVSLDRPYSETGMGQFYYYEMPTVRFVEKYGYNVAYCTDIDLHSTPTLMNNHMGFLSVGHDEYWSMEMYNNALAFRDAGKHLAFMGANAIYWQIRFESSASGKPNRLITCYKASYQQDPVYIADHNSRYTTYLWRELPPGTPSPAVSRPENQLIGVMYEGYKNNPVGQPFVVENSNHWAYTGTGFVNGTSVPGIVGYEFDKRNTTNGLEPAGLVELSSSPVNIEGGGTSTSNATIYQASSGAWVFATGSIYWAYALDKCGFQTTDLRNAGIQKATRNVLDRFVYNPTLIRVDALSPATVNQMESAFTLTVTGSNFVNGATVLWNGSPRPTTFINNGQLTVSISASDILTAGNFPISVTNPDNASSNAFNFLVTVPVVSVTTDGGEAVSSSTSGTLSYALKHVRSGDIIAFASLGAANKVKVNGKLPSVPAGVALDGGYCGSPQVVIDGWGVPYDGLVLMGNSQVRNLKIENFGGRQLVNGTTGAVAGAGPNKVQCTTLVKQGT